MVGWEDNFENNSLLVYEQIYNFGMNIKSKAILVFLSTPFDLHLAEPLTSFPECLPWTHPQSPPNSRIEI